MIEGIYACCTGILEVAIQFLAFGKLVGKKAAPLKLLCFIGFGCIAVGLPIFATLKVFFFLVVLIAGGVVVWETDYKRAVLHGVVTVAIMQLCFGIVNSVSTMLAPYLYPLAPALSGRVLMVGGTVAALGLSCLCYAAVCKCLGQETADEKQSLLAVLAPLLMVLIASGYIDHAIYGNVVTVDDNARADFLGDGSILLVQAVGIISVLCMMHAYRKLAAGACLDARLAMLAQKAHFQKRYVMQAEAHCDSTRALRHDIKNHLSVVRGLLKKGDVGRAESYLGKMDEAAAHMAFPFQTGSPALDALLEDKSALAGRRGIVFEGALKLPSPCFVDEMDLVTILANALDNAIDACGKLPAGAERVVRLSSRVQGELLWLEVENSWPEVENSICQEGNEWSEWQACGESDERGKRHGRCIRQGTGLSNIKAAAGRYGGRVEIRVTDRVFCLNVLLFIPRQRSSTS